MEIDLKKIVSANDIEIDAEAVLGRLDEISELIVFENNQPQFVIMSLEKYFEHERQLPFKTVYTTTRSSKKIGKLVQEVFRSLFREKTLPQSELIKLCDSEYSSATFGLSFAVLKKYDPDLPFDKQKRDENGYNRYYNYLLNAEGTDYLLSSQWVEPLHRKKFDIWCAKWGVDDTDK